MVAFRFFAHHQADYSVCNGIRRRKQNCVGGMHVSRCDRATLMSDQRRNCRLAVTKIGSKRCEGMPENVWRHVRRKGSEFCNTRPEFRKPGHGAIAARSREHKVAGPQTAPQNVAGSVRQRADRSPGLCICKRRRAARKVNLAPTEPQRFTRAPAGEGKELHRRKSCWPDVGFLTFSQRIAECLAFAIAKAAFALTIRKSSCAMNRIVGAQPPTHRIGEDRA